MAAQMSIDFDQQIQQWLAEVEESDALSESEEEAEPIEQNVLPETGVDVFDKMCRQYDVTRNSHRWPLTLFYNFINMAGINGLVIYQINNPEAKIVHRNYLQEVGFQLIRPLLECRISQQILPKSIKLRARQLLGIEDYPSQEPMPVRVGKDRCYFCSRA